MLTQKVIPALYDSLRPFYATRSYRKEHRFPTSGDYPTQLLQDITDILRMEMPHIATLLMGRGDHGHVVQGLVNRRNKEIDLWNTPV
jgi:hypothetical protein